MSSSKIITHAGASIVTKDHACSILAPNKTATWNPIPHGEFINLVEASMQKHGLVIQKQSFALGKEDHQMFGVYDLVSKHNAEHTTSLGIRNSTDKSLPAGLACGSRVFVCDNLAFSAELVVSRRHGNLIMDHLPQMVNDALMRFKGAADNQEREFEFWKATKISVPQATDIICQAVEKDVIAPRAIMEIREEFINPRFPEFQEQNVFNLYNAFTTYHRHIRKPVAIADSNRDLMNLGAFMSKTFAMN